MAPSWRQQHEQHQMANKKTQEEGRRGDRSHQKNIFQAAHLSSDEAGGRKEKPRGPQKKKKKTYTRCTSHLSLPHLHPLYIHLPSAGDPATPGPRTLF